jgi:2'-phosphotransferase
MAKASVIARDSTEFLRIMEANAAKTPFGRSTKYFRLSEFKAGMSKESYKGNTIITTESDLEFTFAYDQFEAEMKHRQSTLTILRLDKVESETEEVKETSSERAEDSKQKVTLEILAAPSKKLVDKIASLASRREESGHGTSRDRQQTKRRRTPSPLRGKARKSSSRKAMTPKDKEETAAPMTMPKEMGNERRRYKSFEKSELSRKLCKLLRHDADKYGLDMGQDGFVPLAEVLKLEHIKKTPLGGDISVETIKAIADESDKERFTLAEDEKGEKIIRANQGHGLKVFDLQKLTVRELLRDDHKDMVCVHGTFWDHVHDIIDEGLLAGGVRDMSRRKMIHFQLVSREVADGFRSQGLRTNCEVMVYVDYQKAINDGMKFFVTTNCSIVSTGFDGEIPYKYVEYMVPALKHGCLYGSTERPLRDWNAAYREGIKIDENHWCAAIAYVSSMGGEVLPQKLDSGLVSVSRSNERYSVVVETLPKANASVAEKDPAERPTHDSKESWVLRIKKCRESAILPKRSSEGTAGYDLYSAENTTVPRITGLGNGSTRVKTGLKMSMPPGVYGRIAPRSGLAVN